MAKTSGLYNTGDVWSKILPRLKQYEATSGRQVTPQAMRGLFRAQLDVEAQRGMEARKYADQVKMEQQRLQIAQDAQDTQFGGMAVSGVTQLGTSAATLGLLARGGLFSPPATTAAAPAYGSIGTAGASALGPSAAPTAFGLGNIPGGGITGQAAMTGFTPVPGAGPLGVGTTGAVAPAASAGFTPYAGTPLAGGATAPIAGAAGAVAGAGLASYGIYNATKGDSGVMQGALTSAPITPFFAAPAGLYKATKGQNPALRGAVAGSVVPGVGTAIGGLLGASGVLGGSDK